ncbi:MAG: TMEM165/GDT1 family protein [Wenzhouxiangellaceae bacterium]|nr:TMEM165/GDT1 family protein [Wenzhouxiangellaceae bacterium]
MESFLVTLPAVALAELGDKTQLVVLYLAARYQRPGAIFAGVLAGAAANVALAVGAAALLDRLIPEGLLDGLVALAFIAIGLWMLLRSSDEEDDNEQAMSGHGAFLAALWLFFIMEMGDKTQLATLALATGLPDPAGVFFGATLGLAGANLPALWLGHRFAARLPRTLLNRISGGLFILAGAVLCVLLFI